MGIATGQLLKGQDVAQSGVVDLAKAVSDMGAGGQVLLDERTFADVKERLRELGAVDAAGIDWKKLTSSRGWLARLTCRRVARPLLSTACTLHLHSTTSWQAQPPAAKRAIFYCASMQTCSGEPLGRGGTVPGHGPVQPAAQPRIGR
jgi:hypothetical protein